MNEKVFYSYSIDEKLKTVITTYIAFTKLSVEIRKTFQIGSVATFPQSQVVKTSRSTYPINASDLINMQIRLTQYLLTIQGEV